MSQKWVGRDMGELIKGATIYVTLQENMSHNTVSRLMQKKTERIKLNLHKYQVFVHNSFYNNLMKSQTFQNIRKYRTVPMVIFSQHDCFWYCLIHSLQIKAFFLTFRDMRRGLRNELIGKRFEKHLQQHINRSVLWCLTCSEII